MFNRLTHHLPHYFQRHLGRQLEELYATVGIQDFALAMMVLFEPIYLFELGHNISHIALFYAIVYGLYIFLIPLGGKIVAWYGPPRVIAASTIFLVLYYVLLVSIGTNPWLFWVAPVVFALQKTLYWPGCHTDFMMTSDQAERGKEYSALYTVSTLMYIIGPVIGGLITKVFGFPVLFTLGAMLIFVSTLPLLLDRTPYVPQPFSYWTTFRQPFGRRHGRSTLAYMGFGEQVLSMYIWPIFMLITFGSVLKLGGLAAAATLLTAIITLGIGKMVDRGQWKQVFRGGAWLTVANWLIRLVRMSPPLVFLSDTIGRVSSNLTFVTATEVAYQRASAEQDPIRRSILLEQGLSFGKLAIAALLALLSVWFPPFTVAFVLAGLFSFLYFIFR